jgi:V/A-type H+-transporting ATPase subunit I
MAVSPIKRLHILAHRDQSSRMIGDLQKLGCVHIEDVGEGLPEEWEGLAESVDVEARDLERRVAELEAAVSYLASYAPSAGLLGGGKIYVTAAQTRKLLEEVDVEEIVTECKRLEQREAERKATEAHWRMVEDHLEPWQALDAQVEEIGPTRRAHVVAGSVPETGFASLVAALSRQKEIHWEVVGRRAGEVYLLVVWLREAEEEAATVLKEAGFVSATFHGLEGRPRDILGRAREELVRVAEGRASDVETARSMGKYRPALMVASDMARHELDRANAARRVAQTGSTIVLRGWIRAGDVGRVEKVAGEEAAVLVADPLDRDDVPVELESRPLVRPFQVVTRLYGLPRYREIDPTPFLAPFFAVSFGLALGEGGYGVLMAVLSYLGLRFVKLSPSMRQLLRLLFVCGIFTFVAGVLLGSFFAVDFERLPGWLDWAAALHHRLKLLDPLKDSMTFLFIVLGIGLVQVWVGVLIRGINRFCRGQRALAVLHEGAWLVALLAAPLAIANVRVGGVNPLGILGVAGASIFVTAGAGKKGIGAKIGAGVYALYGAVGFFGDILSYSRLFALGLATGVVAMVVNILAGMVKGIPVIGWLVMVVLLVFGHLFNLAINALGAFIHTARLQFVEFFTKFFEGGGMSFLPFREEGKHTEIVGPEGQ